MLNKILKVTVVTEYGSGNYIFKEGDYAEYLYSIIEGSVGLEIEKNSSTIIMIDKIIRGWTFGFSALVDTEQKKYTSYAKALTDTKLFKWRGADLEKLFYEDPEMAFLLMKKIAMIAKTRLQIRNVQFLDIYK
jgi:CRP-like cAMP-binding protein